MENVPMISVIISFGALVVASIAAYISWKNAKTQGELTEQLKSRDEDFERKRFITALWDKMSDVTEIYPDEQGEYNEGDIFQALNTLELVALCWSNKVVDRKMIYLAFGDSFRTRVKEIQTITKPLPVLRKTGIELLHQRQIILNVADELEKLAAGTVS